MTERLYYFDSYQTEFDSKIITRTFVNGQPAVVLDRTCFYPTSGGQPHDIGQLGRQRVVDVNVDDNDDIVHLLDGQISGNVLSGVIHGVIDWPRRYDYMQQHSGQHLISQTFAALFGYETVSVHFGADDSTLDLDVAVVEQTQLDEAESYANDLVYESRPITAYFVTESEISSLPLRRPPAVTGKIRIVEIADFDYSACGGAHCRSTGEIGPVKFLRQERRRGQARIVFKCGKRAYADYAQKHHLITVAAGLFSTEIGQVPELIARNLEQIKELQRSLNVLTEQQLTTEAKWLAQSATKVGECRVVAQTFTDKDVNAVKMLANLLQQQPGVIALLGCTAGDKSTIIFARSPEVALHAGNLLRASLGKFGGGGGGRPDFAQGGGISATDLSAALADAFQQIQQTYG